MPSVNSANKNYELMATGENNGTWGIKTNSNLSIVDLNFGGRLDISVAGNTDVTISSSQAQNVYHSLSGTLTGSISYIVPETGSFYIIDNGTTGAFSVTVKMATGAGVVVPQGYAVAVFANPDVPEVVPFFTAPGYVIPISQGGTGQTTAGAAAVALLANSFIGGTSTGSANAQAVTVTSPSTFVRTAGFRLLWTPGFTNTGALTLNEDGTGAAAVQKITSGGLAALSGGEVVVGTPTVTEWNGTNWVLLTNPIPLLPYTSLASATTADLGTIPSRSVTITGTTTITSFGSSASTNYPLYYLSFSGVLTLTHNGTSLIIPGSDNITTVAGDSAVVQYLGSGNWRVINYQRAGATGIVDPAASIGLTQPVGMTITVTSNTAVTVTATQITLTNGSITRVLNSPSLSIALTTSGANGLDTGSEASNTWYYVYAIYNPSTATAAGLLSASSTSPTLPSGYTFYRRIGAVRNNASSNLYRTLQKGSTVVYTIGTNPTATLTMISGSSGSISTPTWTAVSTTSYVPPTAISIYITVFGQTGSVSNGVMAAPSNGYGSYSDSSNAPPIVIAEGTGGTSVPNVVNGTFLLESSNIYYASSYALTSMSALGWTDSI